MSVLKTMGLIFFGLLAVLLFAPCAARAETFPLVGGSGTPSVNNLQFAPDHTQAASTGAVSFTADISSTRASNMVVTFTLGEINLDHTTGFSSICSCTDTWNPASHTTVSCGCAGGATTVGKDLRFNISFNSGLDGEGFPNFGSFFNYSTTTATTMLFCPTAAAACQCDGICNGNTCGTQFTTAVRSDSCSCDCTVAGCTGLAIAAPTLTCVDALDASHASCTWTSVPNTTNYLLDKGGPNVFTGSATAFSDPAGVGNYTYNVHANGSCIPTIGGTTLSSKDSATGSTACSVQSRYSVSISQ